MSQFSRLPPLRALRALEALHQTGSVTGAADLLNVSHSAISHQIKILESWTTQPLFIRQGRMTLLTEAGKSLAGVTHEAFDSIRHEMDRLPIRGMRSISVACLPIAATEWLMPRLRGFTQAYPEINLHLSLSQTDQHISPTPDIEIGFATLSQLTSSDHVLFSGAAVPVCAPALLEAYQGDVAQLISSGPLVFDEDLRMWSLWLKRFGIERVISAATSGLIVEGSALLRAAALSGHGVALCRTAFLDHDLQAGRLVQVSDNKIDEDWCYFLRSSLSKRQEPALAKLLQWLTSDP